MRFSIGEDDFEQLRTSSSPTGVLSYYCDKSLLIKDILEDGSKIILLPRPRRFGKSLNLSMLKYFFGTNKPLFEDLAISQHQNILDGWQGKFPVIFVGFKGLKADNYENLLSSLKICIRDCYRQYAYLRHSEKLDGLDRQTIAPYFETDFSDELLKNSFRYLTEALEKHHGQKVWVLIDEYDTPLQQAYLNGFFPKAIALFKGFLGEVLKSNPSLYKGVMTGITRISKESLFSDLNNIQTYDITRNQYAQYFGFTESEVEAICPQEHVSDLKSWYNGYRFGDGLTIYNPWSILHFLSNQYKLEPYWINTSSNDLIRECLTADKLKDARRLIEGKNLGVEIEPYTVMNNLKENPSSFWNLLFISGYLTLDADRKMILPNLEVRHFFKKILLAWFGGKQGDSFMPALLEDLVLGNTVNLQKKLQQLILESMSFHDVSETNQESFYHGFLLGITLGLRGRYTVRSNRESGYGRYDLALYPNEPHQDPGIVIEVKMGPKVEAGLQQIEQKAYYQDLQTHGCSQINGYSIAFDGKTVSLKSTLGEQITANDFF
ncbi:MAG: AAA family ATPase [Myxococcaceae bacterium]|nr:AAA family ATPase [Myxococcaceae bacterium]